MISPIPCDVATHERLLEAAGEVFADKGFRNATVREICKRAGANVAAVNYHFHDKEGLYEAVLKFAHRCAAEKHPSSPSYDADASAEQKLRAHIRSLLLRTFERGRHTWHGKLMAREMTEPTPALDALVRNQIRPRHEALKAIVRDILGKRASDELLRHCTWSIVGQCFVYRHSHAVFVRLHPEQKFEPADIERIADHVTQFSLNALKGIKTQLERTRK